MKLAALSYHFKSERPAVRFHILKVAADGRRLTFHLSRSSSVHEARKTFPAILPLLLLLFACEVAALDWKTIPQGREAALPSLPIHSAGFALLPPETTGLHFTNLLSPSRGVTNQIYFNGGGVTAADIDGDGWVDLFFAGLSGGSSLFRNLGGWKFQDITATSGILLKGEDATGAVFADVDNDGDMDLLVSTIGAGTHLFLNDGKGHFKDNMTEAGLAGRHGSMSMALGDMDGDGNLDLYIANYRPATLRDRPRTNFRVNVVDGRPVVAQVNGAPADQPELQGRFTLTDAGKIIENGELDSFFLNDGHGKFRSVPLTGGAFLNSDGSPIQPPYDWGLSVMIRDLNGDGRPDIYVCNDFDSPDRIWINQGNLVFRAMDEMALRTTSKFSMGIDVADIDRDGYDDIFIADMLGRDHVTRLTRAHRAREMQGDPNFFARAQVMRNTLQWNRGDGTYAEIAYLAGLEASDWSWTPLFLDVDLDGYEDLLVSAGHLRDDMDKDSGARIESEKSRRRLSTQEELSLRLATPNLARPRVAFRNSGQLSFEDRSAAWGFNQTGFAHGMCLADLDNDGDLDVVVNQMNGPAAIYRNESSAPRVAVRLRGEHNRRGIGARIVLKGGAVPLQSQEMIAGGRYLSSDDPMRVFAAGSSNRPMRIEVLWPGKKRSVLENIRANRIYEISEASAASYTPSATPPDPLFEDVSSRLAHASPEEDDSDFQTQPLLPRKWSRPGPGLLWADLNQDGWPDLVIPAARGGTAAVFTNDAKGGFAESRPRSLSFVPEGQGSLLLLPVAGGGAQFVATHLGSPASLVFSTPDDPSKTLIIEVTSNPGPLAVADIDGDGLLDIFVGGRPLPGRYPASTPSALFRQRDGKWLEETPSDLKNLGIVNAAVWVDLENDGFPELVVACDWGPLRLFRNAKGRLAEVTQEWGAQESIGWWQSLAVGDFDGDGKLDIAAGNWGRNSKYQAHLQDGVFLYFDPKPGAAITALVEAYKDPVLGKIVPFQPLDLLSAAIPGIKDRFSTFRAYAQASVDEILGPDSARLQRLEVNFLDSTIFLNRGGRFEAISLPAAAQETPISSLSVADFDGDGAGDLFISQNFAGVHPESSRCDAGTGMILKGLGNGHFEALSPGSAGIRMSAEQRGSAADDFDHDGRPDLVVAQLGGQTRLYHNVKGVPQTRLRFRGPPANPWGIGTSAVLAAGPGAEVRRCVELRADAPEILVPFSSSEREISVLCPGGREFKTRIPAGARVFEISLAP